MLDVPLLLRRKSSTDEFMIGGVAELNVCLTHRLMRQKPESTREW